MSKQMYLHLCVVDTWIIKVEGSWMILDMTATNGDIIKKSYTDH